MSLLSDKDALAQLGKTQHPFNRGIERECLRIDPRGRLAQTPHPNALGAPMTHASLTTDFAEQLLEFITPVAQEIEPLLDTLADIHKFCAAQLGNELLWPMSMPCFVHDEADVQLANYGLSNIGRLKTLYRQGLKNRYGAMMQVIAGVHYNFSLNPQLWQVLYDLAGEPGSLQEFISARYMGLIRNFYRYGWLLPYLFGASPALCGSFLHGKRHSLPFHQLGKGTLYLPHATSLRLSDLGYTNSAQAGLNICYNSVDDYLASLSRAIRTTAEEFHHIGVKVNGEYRQLNDKVLQIENELYAPVRPKRVSLPGEHPSQALARGGVEYIEVRSLDVNPFSPLGIDAAQIRFLDLFLSWCLLAGSQPFAFEELQRCRSNLKLVVLQGRQPGLKLDSGNGELSLADWGRALLDSMAELAEVLDGEDPRRLHQQTLAAQRAKLEDPERTPSARIVTRLLGSNLDNGELGLTLAREYQQQWRQQPYRRLSSAEFEAEAERSWGRQKEIEQADTLSFDDFMDEYFEYLR